LSGNWNHDSDKLDGGGIEGSGEFFPVARTGPLPERGLLSLSSRSALLWKVANIVQIHGDTAAEAVATQFIGPILGVYMRWDSCLIL